MGHVGRSTVLGLSAFVLLVSGTSAAQEPDAWVVPASGPPASSVRVAGRAFFKSPCAVAVYLDSVGGRLLGMAEVADDRGRFSVLVSLPDDITFGPHMVIAQGLVSEGEQCGGPSTDSAQAPLTVAPRQIPIVSGPITPFRFTGDLRDLPAKRRWMPGDPFRIGPGQEEGEEEGPGLSLGPHAAGSGGAVVARGATAAASSGGGAALPAPTLSVDGVPNTGPFGVIPPDVAGDVGPNHYIEMVNATFAVFDKQGTMLAGPSDINTLWIGTGTPCEFANDGDPDVRYDPLADRWIMSQFVVFTHQCIAVSVTADPLGGGWYLYAFPTNGIVNDYPKLAVWPDAYYLGTQRGYLAFNPMGADAWALDRAAMLNGSPAMAVILGDTDAFMLPSDLDGSLPPPGARNVFVRHVNATEFGGADRLELREFDLDWSNPGLASLIPLPDLPVAPFEREMCTFSLIDFCIPQPGTGPLESLTAWLLTRLQYRNFGTHETLVVNHTVDADGSNHAGIRWYELRKTAGTWSIHQQGTHAPDEGAPGLGDDLHRWMGSTAMDRVGNIAVGFSAGSSSVFPEIRYAGRLVTDPLGSMAQGEAVIVGGGGAQDFGGRWGDYSTLTLDPADDCTFWFATEYYKTTSAAGWDTRIATFRFPSCTPPITCELAGPELVSRDGRVGNNASTAVAINTDGRFVAFPSNATNLVSGDRNDLRDVLVRDRQNGTTERVSVSSNSDEANGPSHARGGAPAISGDGRFVAFYSDASNLVAADANKWSDVFVRDRIAGTTERVSVATGGSEANGPSLYPSISEDGRFVAFQSLASNLVVGDTNGFADIFVHDRLMHTTQRACNTVEANGPSTTPSISPEGTFVAFASAATNWVPNDTNRRVDIFVCNLPMGLVDLVSINTAGEQGNGDSILPAISGNGGIVAFKSLANNLVPDDRNNLVDVFARDRNASSTERISVNHRGGDADDVSFPPSVSHDGRFVAFGSLGTNLVTSDTNETSNVFVRDRQSGLTEFVDRARNGQQANRGTLDVAPAVAGNGGKIGFVSLASNLDGPDNEAPDVFVACNPFIPVAPSLVPGARPIARQPAVRRADRRTKGNVPSRTPRGHVQAIR